MESIVRAVRACGNRHRLRLLRAVLDAGRAVRQNDLVEALHIAQFLAARYLQILVDGGLLVRERRGLPVVYRPARGGPPHVRRLLRFVASLSGEFFDIPPAALERIKKGR